MKITFKNTYRAQKTGKLQFVYVISGTPEELEAYKKTKGVHYREDAETKQPVMFSQTRYDDGTSLKPNKAGTQFYVDDTEQQIYAEACKKGGVEYAREEVAKFKALQA